MQEQSLERFSWREHPDAVELGFSHYLNLIERRLQGEDISLVQGLRQFYQTELGVSLRETQARGLMHRDSSVFIDYVNQVTGERFTPNVEYWETLGLDAFLSWTKRFNSAQNIAAIDLEEEQGDITGSRRIGREGPAVRRTTVVRQIYRDNALSRFLKYLYDSHCQVCGFSFPLPRGGIYVECHHIRPLGNPHQGPDIENNMLVLCPNHHAMMDYGVIAVHPENRAVLSIDPSLAQQGQPLQLQKHVLKVEFLEYHYTHHFGR
ncbi:MAG: HNH endonuclease [Chloroflexi bacterium]|nr:HNH endonuclease [Chloroflexota bacterium]